MKTFIALLLLTSLTSCVETGTREDLIFQEAPTIEPGSPDEIITYADIRANILEPFGCINCHSRWANNEEGLLSRVTPGEPFSSPFYLRMEDGSMPLGGPSVDRSRLEYVERFIRQLGENR